MNKVKLSKGILQMKFMMKTKEKVEKEEDDAEGRALYSNEITHKMLHGSSNYIVEPSYTACEDLIHGRVSYGGMNPEIEKMIAIEKFGEQKVKEDEERLANQKMKTDVSDNDMAKFYTSVVKTIAKKYEGVKRLGEKRKKKQDKFMKPKDD